MVGWWSCRIKLARSQEIGSICMCYAMRIHKSPICLQGKKVSRRVSSWCGSTLWGKWGSRRPWPLFPQNVRNVYTCFYIYFLHLPLLFFRTEIIVMTISVFYKKRTRKLPNTNWGRLRILFLLLFKGFDNLTPFSFLFFFERKRRGKSRGRDSVQSSLIIIIFELWWRVLSSRIRCRVLISFI